MLRFIRQTLHSARPNICEDVAVWGRKQGWPVSDIYEPIYRSRCVFSIGLVERRILSLVSRYLAPFLEQSAPFTAANTLSDPHLKPCRHPLAVVSDDKRSSTKLQELDAAIK
jgi:hypothetical protein